MAAHQAGMRIRLCLRLLGALGWLLVCVGPSALAKARRAPHNPWPRRFLRGVARIFGIAIAVRGQRAPGRVLLLANHVSWIDIVVLSAASGCAFVGHDGLAGIPLLRWLCRQNDTVFIARHDKTGVAAQVGQLRRALGEMGAVALFPEGTTGDGTGLLPFKSSLLGALEPWPEGVAVQPVWLDYGADAAQVAWFGMEPGLTNFMRVVGRRRPANVIVHFLPMLTGPALASRKTVTAAARETICAVAAQA
jgi:1-acyl-sn-glycerol-3-phosphate acyltransferase